jgi:hypothetical protein
LLARAAQLDASHYFRRSAGLHYRVCVGRAFPAFFLFFEALSYGKQVRQALIKRRMAWIERERKRRFVGVFLLDLRCKYRRFCVGCGSAGTLMAAAVRKESKTPLC